MTRTVSSVQAVYYRPYSTALSHLLTPGRMVKNRSEGSVSEGYDAEGVIAHLRQRAAEWDALLPDDEATDDVEGGIDLTTTRAGY